MITITKNKDILSLKTNFNGDIQWHDLKLSVDVPQDVLVNWLLMHVKPIYNLMPFDDSKFKIHCDNIEDVKQAVFSLADVIEATNEAIRKESSCWRGVGDKVLFWNISEDMRYLSLYNRLNKNNDIKYLNLDLGYDRVNREWNHTDIPMTIDEFCKYLSDNEIGKIVTVNQYVLDKYVSSTAVNLMALSKHLGVEWVTIDNDPADLNISGYYRRYAYNDTDNARFSNLSCLVEHFDNKYDANNIHYVGIPQDYGSEERKVLNNDYDIIVLSNSRYKNVKSMLPGIEAVCNALPEQTLYQDINTWYLAMRKLILEIMPLDELKQFKLNTLLHHFYFACVQWIKFKIIGDIETDRRVKVYGDVGWVEVCPQYYEESLDNNQVNTLYSESNHLYLLLNCSFSYLDASGPVYDVIRRNVPWVNVPPMVKTEVFGALQSVEYTDKVSLNELINNFISPCQDGFHESLRSYSDILNSSITDIETNVIYNKHIRKAASSFTDQRYRHEVLINDVVNNYLRENEPFLRHCYDKLFVGNI